MVAYYNENDPFATQWLRELIATGLICPGEVDERSIEDVRPGDLAGYTQCHFFAGIGVWSLALRQAGWRDDRPIWTGSCPCQPFSAAGKAGGFADERHLWPAFFHLIEQCAPDIVVGEQVASKDGLAWLDLVSSDMEAARYAFGAVDTCAAGFGAPHIRQRLYFGAKRLGQSDSAGRFSRRQGSATARQGGSVVTGSRAVRLADSDDARSQEQRCDRGISRGAMGSFAWQSAERGGTSTFERPGPTNGLWRNVDWLFCRDGKWRPVESSPLALVDDGSVRDLLAGGGRASDALTFPLSEPGAFKNRVAELRGAGNAVNLAQAASFIASFAEASL